PDLRPVSSVLAALPYATREYLSDDGDWMLYLPLIRKHRSASRFKGLALDLRSGARQPLDLGRIESVGPLRSEGEGIVGAPCSIEGYADAQKQDHLYLTQANGVWHLTHVPGEPIGPPVATRVPG